MLVDSSTHRTWKPPSSRWEEICELPPQVHEGERCGALRVGDGSEAPRGTPRRRGWVLHPSNKLRTGEALARSRLLEPRAARPPPRGDARQFEAMLRAARDSGVDFPRPTPKGHEVEASKRRLHSRGPLSSSAPSRSPGRPGWAVTRAATPRVSRGISWGASSIRPTAIGRSERSTRIAEDPGRRPGSAVTTNRVKRLRPKLTKGTASSATTTRHRPGGRTPRNRSAPRKVGRGTPSVPMWKSVSLPDRIVRRRPVRRDRSPATEAPSSFTTSRPNCHSSVLRAWNPVHSADHDRSNSARPPQRVSSASRSEDGERCRGGSRNSSIPRYGPTG